MLTSPIGPRTALLGAATTAGLLLLTAPSPAAAVRVLGDSASAADPTAPLVAALTLLAWPLVGWLLLTVLITAGAHLPGAAGRSLAVLARRVAPAAVRRTVELGLGLTVAVGTLGAGSALAAAGPAAPAAPSGAHLDASTPAPAPALDWAAPAPPRTPVTPATPPERADAVVVEPGDSLWRLAERDLAARGRSTTDAAVAQAWPTWWGANRDAVGDDPDLLRPGTPLTPPADS